MNTKHGETFTEKTRDWLEGRFRVNDGEIYRSHQPIYGVNEHCEHSEPDHLWRAAKTVQIMRVLSRLEFSSILDVGAAEGYTANLVKKFFDVDVVVSDVSHEAMLRARDLFGLHGVSLNASNLPFKDNSFDVVICAECIEHLENPYELLLDAARVARKCLIISTVEGRGCYPASWLQVYRLPIDEPHGHRSNWCRRDFEKMFGSRVVTTCQNIVQPWTRLEDDFATLKSVTVPPPLPHIGEGIIMHVLFDELICRANPRWSDDELIRGVLDFNVELRPATVPPENEPPPQSVVEILQCPGCRKGSLTFRDGSLFCNVCAKSYSSKGGVPDLFESEPANLEELAQQTKLGTKPGVRERLHWARKQTRRYNREPRIKSAWINYYIIGRLIQFIEHVNVHSGFKAKFGFVVGKVIPWLKPSPDFPRPDNN